MIALLILACWWPSSAPSPSQPLIVEVSVGASDSAADTESPGMAPAGWATEAQAPSPVGSAEPEPRPGEPQAKADPGVGGDHAD